MATEKAPVLKTPFGVCSFPYLAEPRAAEKNKKATYSVAIVFTPSVIKKYEGKALLRALKDSALAVARGKWGDKADDLIERGKLHWPFRRVEDEEEDSSFAQFEPGTVWIQPSSTGKPGCVDRFADKNGKPVVIADADMIDTLYPGCIIRASVRAYAFDKEGNKGVSFALNNVQKVAEGERIDGRKAASEEFDALDDEPVEMDDDDTPAPRRRAAVDDEDAPAPKKRRPADADDEDEDAPAPKKRRTIVEDEDDDAPAPRKRASRDVI